MPTIPHVIQLAMGISPPGGISLGDKHYTAQVSTPNVLWVVIHNLGKLPAVSITNNSGKQIEAEVIYDNANQCSIRFNSPTSGFIHLN